MAIASTPPEILALMTTTVGWESFLGFDGHAEPRYAPLIDLRCWQEPHPPGEGGLDVYRRADNTVVEPRWDFYFSGDDPNAKKIRLYDRFSPKFSDGKSLQAVRVSVLSGPNFDNRNVWLIQVTT